MWVDQRVNVTWLMPIIWAMRRRSCGSLTIFPNVMRHAESFALSLIFLSTNIHILSVVVLVYYKI